MSVIAYAITTRQRLQDFMGLTSPTAVQQSVLDRIIDGVTDFVEHYCRRRFKKTTYSQEVYDGTGGTSLMLKNYPISTVVAISLQERSSVANEDDWETIDTEDYFVQYNEGQLEFIGNMVFRQLPRAYRITYTAGYDFDPADVAKTAESVGLGDLEYAVWKLCMTAYDSRNGSGNVESERLGDYGVTFRKQVMEDDEIKNILDKYARIDYIL